MYRDIVASSRRPVDHHREDRWTWTVPPGNPSIDVPEKFGLGTDNSHLNVEVPTSAGKCQVCEIFGGI